MLNTHIAVYAFESEEKVKDITYLKELQTLWAPVHWIELGEKSLHHRCRDPEEGYMNDYNVNDRRAPTD